MQKLAASFVPAADAVDRLQAGKDADCLLFQKFARQPLTLPARVRGTGSGRDEIGVRQGAYAVTPSGMLLASANTPDPRDVAHLLRLALEKWKSLAREQRLLPEAPDPRAADNWRRWAKLYPRDGLVLSVVCRDLPREDIPDQWRDAWNQDYAWFRQDEARRFLPAALNEGATQKVPRELVERLVRFHLVDNVRARNYDAFPKECIESALQTTVTRVRGDLVSLRIEGATRVVVTAPENRGYTPKLLGHATYDRRKGSFTTFELLALGMRWGAGNCNQRQDDPGPAPMGVLLTLAGKGHSEQLPPAFISHYGWD